MNAPPVPGTLQSAGIPRSCEQECRPCGPLIGGSGIQELAPRALALRLSTRGGYPNPATPCHDPAGVPVFLSLSTLRKQVGKVRRALGPWSLVGGVHK